ncbi:hypothetical protein [Psychroserpens sp. S379A]|uniref:hypothetical protein n=1 Tax=Psychroserpens sp. S379A TaxID=3415137 RepID=UPI003C7A1570
MKKLLQSNLLLFTISCLLFFSCTTESDETETACECEEITCIEEKYVENGIWLLNRIETNRVAVECQDETDFIRTGNGTEARSIQCNNN